MIPLSPETVSQCHSEAIAPACRQAGKNLARSVILNAVKDLMGSYALLRTSFTEFTLSQKARPFASLRVTHGEGFRMTNTPIPLLRHSLPGGEKWVRGYFLGK